MKQAVSVIPNRPDIPRILFFIVLFFVGCTAIFIWSKMSSYSNWKAEIEVLEAQNEVIKSRIAEENESANLVPSTQDLNALAKRVSWYNYNLPDGLDPVLSFLSILEDNLPSDVKLNDFFYDLDGGTVTMSLLSASEQSLLAMLRQLQDALTPMSLTLDRQISLDGVDQRFIQYDLRVAK